MKRVAGTILFGFGVLFVVLAIGLPVYVAPAVTKLPYDLDKSTSLVEAKGATYLQVKDGAPKINTGNLVSTTYVVPRSDLTEELQGQFNNEAVVWDVYSSTANAAKEKISESSTQIALDRVSGAAYAWSGAWVNEGAKTPTKFTGHSYKFPFGTEKKDYPFWDGEMGNSSLPAKFEGVETLDGVEVYRFKQVVPWFKTATDETSRAVLLSTFAKTATTGDIWYQNTRTLWVEPVTGQFLNIREQREQEFRDDAGGKTTLLKADFTYTKETRDNGVNGAKENKFLVQMISLYAPITLGILSLLLIVVGGLMARSKPSQYTAGHGI